MTQSDNQVREAIATAGDGFLGTWKSNEGKSKIGAGSARNSMVVYAAEGDKVKVVIDGTDGAGATLHSEWTGKYDAQDYAVTGDASSDTPSPPTSARPPASRGMENEGKTRTLGKAQRRRTR